MKLISSVQTCSGVNTLPDKVTPGRFNMQARKLYQFSPEMIFKAVFMFILLI